MKYVTGDKSNTFTKSNNLEKKSKGYLSEKYYQLNNLTMHLYFSLLYYESCGFLTKKSLPLS